MLRYIAQHMAEALQISPTALWRLETTGQLVPQPGDWEGKLVKVTALDGTVYSFTRDTRPSSHLELLFISVDRGRCTHCFWRQT